jgi:hypothetical protein
MEVRRTKAGDAHPLGLVAKRLREDCALTREPLPERWIDLINHLNEMERRSTGPSSKGTDTEEPPRDHSDNSHKSDT